MHRLDIDGFSGDLRVVRFAGWEGISEQFAFEITAVSPDAAIVLDGMVGQKARLSFDAGDEEPRQVAGVIARFEHGESAKKLTAYRIQLVPTAHRLRLRRDCRIFQEMTVPDVIKKVLAGAGLGSAHRFALEASYEPREYCVQYRESDADFIARLAEEEGIHFYFEHGDSGDVLVFADRPSAHTPIGGESTIVFRPPSGALVSREHVSALRWAEVLRTGKVTLRDYNFKRPSLLLEGDAESKRDDDLESYDYPGEYDAPTLGKSLAAVRLGEQVTARQLGQGASACARLIPGSTFTLAEHPREDLNREYLVTRVEHRGSEPEMEGEAASPYDNTFEVVRADVDYRPPRTTPRPTVNGIQTATVVGPAGEEIHVDEHGRIKVQFHWDRLGKKDERSSCWIRVAQAWTGAAFGAFFIPRIGHEVVVAFLEGDPDRPLVTGSVHHGTDVPPYPLPANKTRSTMRTNTTPGGGGFNELRFEDKKSSEEVYLHAQKDFNSEVENDRTAKVGHNDELRVSGDRDETIVGSDTEAVGAKKTITVGASHTETIAADMTLTVGAALAVTVGGAATLGVSGALATTVAGDMAATVEGQVTEQVQKSVTEEVGEGKSVTIGKAFALATGEDTTLEVGGAWSEDVAKTKTVKVGETYELQVGDGKVTVKKNGDITIEGKQITIKGSGPIKVQGASLEVKSDGAVSVKASGAVKVQGGTVDVN